MELARIRAMPKEIMVQSMAAPVDRAFVADNDDWMILGESTTRSYHIVAKVQELLREDTPARAILEIIRDLQDAP